MNRKRRPIFVWVPSQIGQTKDNVATSIATLFGALRCAIIYLEKPETSHADVVASLRGFYARTFDSVYMFQKYQQMIEVSESKHKFYYNMVITKSDKQHLSTTLRMTKLELEQQRKKVEVQEKVRSVKLSSSGQRLTTN